MIEYLESNIMFNIQFLGKQYRKKLSIRSSTSSFFFKTFWSTYISQMQSSLKRDTTQQNKRAVIFSIRAMGDLFSCILKYLLKGKYAARFHHT